MTGTELSALAAGSEEKIYQMIVKTGTNNINDSPQVPVSKPFAVSTGDAATPLTLTYQMAATHEKAFIVFCDEINNNYSPKITKVHFEQICDASTQRKALLTDGSYVCAPKDDVLKNVNCYKWRLKTSSTTSYECADCGTSA